MMDQRTESLPKTDINIALAKQPILLFDGECGFCNKTVQFFLKNENSQKRMHFAPLESEMGKSLREYFEIDPKIDSIILIKEHSAYIKSCAALRLAPFMKGLWPALIVFVVIPPFLRNIVYDFIAKRRKKIFGRVRSCELLANEDKKRFLDR
jgi:predicted DCC family thiol-disulfide oxidoreductase YuxK